MLEFRIYLDRQLVHKTVFSKKSLTIGRSAENDIVLSNKHVSRVHVLIQEDENAYWVEDRSSNGLLLDGEKIAGRRPLPAKCRFQIYPYDIECLKHQEEDEKTAPLLKEQRGQITEKKEVQLVDSSGPVATHFGVFVGESPVMSQIYRLIEHVADRPVTVMINGEHGTGKELVALAIHRASQRSSKPFIAVNCAAIPVDLIESELFGHEKGAFTGAHAVQKGKIEEASGGTLFLDEIGELSLQAQAKLLRFLQEKTIMRLGSSRETSVDVRVVAATNRDLEKAVREGSFRADLYYRLKVVSIITSPLKKHPEDIPLLTSWYLQKSFRELNLEATPVITEEAMKLLLQYEWPGNVRQLENVLYSAVIRSTPPYLISKEILLSESIDWFEKELFKSSTEAGPLTENPDENPIEEINKKLLLKVLEENSWDTIKAAERLKVSRGTVYYKMKKYGIDPDGSKKRDSSNF